ncbi:hypothetical protein DL768_007554 [Monosporascus sp. mg162]|nr:hypothetical protein DL768_007554 [Monosporascus sp. mg162]
MVSNTPPVDIYPFLAYLPDFLARWKTRAAHVSKVLYDVYGCLVNAAKEKAASGKQYPYTPVLVRLIRERNLSPDRGNERDEESFGDAEPPIRDSQLLSLGSGLLDASVDSMHAVVETLILIMVKHPSKLARLRAEIDAVTITAGQVVAPDESRLAQLPYLQACILETLRFRTPAPLLIPRMLTRDDVIDGYILRRYHRPRKRARYPSPSRGLR